jgi:hypothetical protein
MLAAAARACAYARILLPGAPQAEPGRAGPGPAVGLSARELRAARTALGISACWLAVRRPGFRLTDYGQMRPNERWRGTWPNGSAACAHGQPIVKTATMATAAARRCERPPWYSRGTHCIPGGLHTAEKR